ncbi:glycyl-radical enzyme activating protein [Propionispora vibrioides]|uniref:Pyruvate formate lyase activating enzyme n=1 Tax=Propionispora vibrioides TaxID=112903 RepID=A0A1H8T6T0_9FIRM|nr:glycyl-radical enzyme activating protein [Propionispora vibrioides]SEO86621.1 pyruvate formate lyase activating enzyme [Propionispora vibrioides]
MRVFDIERFAIHDGSGIRTVVFLQGCPLRCPWCANPESWHIETRLMYIKSKCVACGRCASVCPVDAIKLSDNRLNIDRRACTTCGACVEVCPHNALYLAGKVMTTSEILRIVMRDHDYYRNSGGGITLSGGEPFFQFQGALALLRESKEAGLHTAVETTGQVNPLQFCQAIPLVDQFLFDLKHCDPVILKEFTGGDLSLIKQNLQAAAEQKAEMIILRVPVVPGFNNNQDTIDGIYKIALENNISTVHLLPYHTLGKSKFAQLGLEYPYKDELPMLKNEELVPFCEIGKAKGLAVRIGG